MSRPRLLVGVVGTATEVGKTWVGAAMLTELRRRDLSVAARKPIQSHDPDDGAPLDADVLAGATGERSDEVCAPDRTYPVPMAPPMAADVLGIECPLLSDLVWSLRWPDAVDVGIVETVGGVCSPVAVDGHSSDLVRSAGVDVVVLVADAGLGTIDAVRTALPQLHPFSGSSADVIVVLNRFDPADDLHRRNLDWLRTVDSLDPCTAIADVADRLADRLR